MKSMKSGLTLERTVHAAHFALLLLHNVFHSAPGMKHRVTLQLLLPLEVVIGRFLLDLQARLGKVFRMIWPARTR